MAPLKGIHVSVKIVHLKHQTRIQALLIGKNLVAGPGLEPGTFGL